VRCSSSEQAVVAAAHVPFTHSEARNFELAFVEQVQQVPAQSDAFSHLSPVAPLPKGLGCESAGIPLH
jgi:hypothetical protein